MAIHTNTTSSRLASTGPTPKPSTSRRALLAGGLGGLAALAASAIGRSSRVRASDGDPVTVGGNFTADSDTAFTAPSDALGGNSTSGSGIYGISVSGYGVYGSSTSSYGVYGTSYSSSAIYGYAGTTNLPAMIGWSVGNQTGVEGYSGVMPPTGRAKTGVYGQADQDTNSKGVWGHSPAGQGVRGSTTVGYAGYFDGKVYTTKFYEMTEISVPSAPGANKARLFVRDSGGKTQLCVRYNTGAIQVLNTQP